MLRGLDAFEGVPREFSSVGGEASWTGRLFFAMLGYIVIALLSVTEITVFSSSTWTTETVVSGNMDKAMSVQFNITFPMVPCRYLQLGARDRFGMQGSLVHSDSVNFVPVNQDEVDHDKAYLREGEAALNRLYDHDDYTDPEEEKEEVVQLDSPAALPTSEVFLHNNFTDVISFHDFTLVYFYADWCDHSRKFHRTWNKLAKLAGEGSERLHFPDEEGYKKPVTLVRMNCGDFKDACRDLDIPMYPTLRLYKRDGNIFTTFKHEKRTFNHILDFLEHSMRSSHFLDAQHQAIFSEGCQINGLLNVPRVQGFIQLTAEPSHESSLNPDLVNMTHSVGHFSFGDTEANLRNWAIFSHLKTLGVPSSILDHLQPLNDQQFVVDRPLHVPEHHLKVINTKIGERNDLYQITHTARVVNSAEVSKGRAIPQARFSYDFSPLSVVLQKTSKPWYDFLTSLIAILGGTYTVVQLCGGAAENVGIALNKVPAKCF
jgi:thiol-disulfide isomerase/thioredoxin